MTKYYHVTNDADSNAPSSSDLAVGEIVINSTSLGNASDGYQSGRLYIKLNDNTIRRFISVGLPGSVDPALKIKYGGTNNTFSTVTAATETTSDALMLFKYNANNNHSIDKAPNDKLTWNATNNRLNINRTSLAQATIHVGGNAAIDTMTNWAGSEFDNSTFKIAGWSNSDKVIYGIPSASFANYFPANSIPMSKVSGLSSAVQTLAQGGTGADLTAFSPSEGNILYYSVSGSRFAFDNDLRWSANDQALVLNGAFEFNPPADTLNNAVPIGVDSTNRIVRMDYVYNQDLRTTDDVTFGSVTVSDADGLELTSMTQDTTAEIIAVDAGDKVVKLGYNIDQDLKTTSDVTLKTVQIANTASSYNALVIPNLQTGTGTTLIIDGSNRVLKDSSSRRFKDNIQNYAKGLSDVLQIDPKTFTFKDDESQTLRAGLIAEELEDLGLNEFVIKDENNLPSAVSYDKMIALLINSIKELKKEIDDLKTKIQ